MPNPKITDTRGLGDLLSHREEGYNQRLVVAPGQFGKPVKALPAAPAGGPPALTPEKQAEVAEAARIVARAISSEAPFTRRPNYLDPPPDADPVDVYTQPTVILPPAAVNQVILHVEAPAGSILVIWRFANDIDNPLAWNQVSFSFTWKTKLMAVPTKWRTGSPLVDFITYREIRRSLGNVQCPCRLEMPLILRDGGVLELVASNSDIVQHLVQARLMGWSYIPGFKSSYRGLSPEFQV